MNFQQTISELYRQTEKITVYAMPARRWVDGRNLPDIGIRASILSYPNHDPMIGGNVFMICGEAADCGGNEIFSFNILKDILLDQVDVSLRAITTFPMTTVRLGSYRITNRTLADRDVLVLDLERR